MGRAALAAALSISVVWASCYSPATAPTSDDDVRLWRSQANQRKDARSGQTGPIDLHHAVARALEYSSRLRQADAMIAIARAEVQRAGQPRNPDLRVNNLHIDRLVEQDPSIEVAIRVPIPVPGRLAALQGAARAAVQRRLAQRTVMAARAADNVRQIFVEMAEIVGLIDLSVSRLSLLKLRLEHTKAGLARNLTTAAEVSRRQLEVSLEEDERQELLGRRRQLERELATHIGSPLEEALTLTLPPLPPSRIESPQALTKLALTSSGHRQDRAWAVAAAEAQLHAERTESWPWFDFAQLGYTFRSPLHTAAFGLGFAFKIPLFHQNSGGIRRARAELSRAQLAREDVVMTIANNVAARHQSFLQAQSRYAAVVKGPLVEAERYVAKSRDGVNAGLRPRDDLFRAQLRLIAVQRRALRAQIGIRRAYAALVATVGKAVAARQP